TKAGYTMKERKIEYTDDDGRVRGIISYQYPQFKGTSKTIKKINSKLKKECTKFFQGENPKNISESIQSSIDNNRFYDKEERYIYQTTCEITYNKNNIVSISMNQKWYSGGVNNTTNYGFNYNLKTGKKLGINDVISGDAKKKILEAAKEYCGSDTVAYDAIKNTKEKDYKFYFSKGKVYICYGSYELMHGTSWDIFTVTGKYK
ncbi:PdaC/SigV domain-containing protein, partial [Anaerosporobacter sp.]